jgi:proteasome lid subunit RPN8/RPN11
MSILVGDGCLDSIRKHGEATYPEECGGLLLGILDNGVRVIREIARLENVREDSRHNRVALDPLAYAQAERDATRRGLGVWGYYHSHPDHPAVPSAYDLEHAAFVEWSYLIVSVQNGIARDIRSWNVSDDRSQFDEENILRSKDHA